jgi:hypothetical protein
MKAIETITGRVSVLMRDDIDTDQIIPKQFLKRVERTGYGEFLFYDWLRDGEIELESNPILVTGRNFGCGSSREHAAWALEDYGFKAVIAPSEIVVAASQSQATHVLLVHVAGPILPPHIEQPAVADRHLFEVLAQVPVAVVGLAEVAEVVVVEQRLVSAGNRFFQSGSLSLRACGLARRARARGGGIDCGFAGRTGCFDEGHGIGGQFHGGGLGFGQLDDYQ